MAIDAPAISGSRRTAHSAMTAGLRVVPWGMFCAAWALAAVLPAAEIKVTSATFEDPRFDVAIPPKTFSAKLKPLWLTALAHPEADLQRQAAETIALAHKRGMPGLADTADALVAALDASDQHPVVRLAAARALVVLEARAAADALFRHAQADGLEMAQLVEPALAAWDFQPIRAVWLERIANPQTPRRLLVLAMRGLQTVKEPAAAPRLRELALKSRGSSDLRLAAAEACGAIQTQGLEQDARTLIGNERSGSIVDRMLAARLLGSHRGPEAETLLLDLAADPEPAVAALAWTRLLAIDPALVRPLMDQALADRDANIRLLAEQALAAQPTAEHIARLGVMLDDPHPENRRAVRNLLLKLADDQQFSAAVGEAAMQALATEKWRALEQAALVVTALDHRPAAPRLVELLEFERPEVYVTAAFALRKLAMPETLGPALDKAQRQSEVFLAPGHPHMAVDEQVSQLFQMFGQMKYAPAEPLLRKYVPKSLEYGNGSRGSAVWALGHLHAGRSDSDLVSPLIERLSDTGSIPSESPYVRQMSALSLGRMQARAALPVLLRYYAMESNYTPLGWACQWAIQVQGEQPPPPKWRDNPQIGWFLTPLEDSAESLKQP